jgi:hypothetical protein
VTRTDRRGFSIRIFLPDGSPDGLRIVEKSNWTGCGIVCPRPLFPEAKSRDEFDRTGVYVLLGPPQEGELPEIYIGEGDPIRQRLERHQAEKDFWTSAICFTSKDSNLNKAHVQYLESRLIELASGAKRSKLHNGNVPKLPSLSEADIADAETFLAEMLLCFPVLGVSIFEKPEKPKPQAVKLMIKKKGIHATGYESAGGFVVQKGSGVVKKETECLSPTIRKTRSDLLKNNVVIPKGIAWQFSQDYEFSSPSMAAAFVLARTSNGRTEWRTPDGKTLKELQESP